MLKRNMIVSAALLLAFVCMPLPSQANDTRGFYIEGGGVLMVPFAGEKIYTVDPIFGYSQTDANAGGGFQLATGFDFGPAGIGTKIYYTQLASDPAGAVTGPPLVVPPDLEVDVFGMDLETKIYLARLGGNEASVINPYILLGVGWGIFNPDFRESDEYLAANLGLGTQILLGDILYLGLEGSYRPLFGADGCGFQKAGTIFSGDVYGCDDNDDVHTVQFAALIGARF